jgi:hypothetical protein
LAKSKNEEMRDVSAFPEDHVMNSWESDGREVDIAAERTRVSDKRVYGREPTRHRGHLYFPMDQVPPGWKYGWFTERLLNEPQNDNLQDAYENGWDFVKQSDHPTYMVRGLYDNVDNRIRRRNNILMKKPEEEWLASQNESFEESASKQREIASLTEYFGSAPGAPKFVVENKGSYTPNYRHRGN